MSLHLPITEARHHDQESGTLLDFTGLGARIPVWANPEDILVDVEPILEICRLSRITTLEVIGIEEPGEVKAKILSISNDVAIGSAEQMPAEHSSENAALYKFLVRNHRAGNRAIEFTQNRIGINVADIQERAAKDGESLKNAKVWAEYIDDGLRKELRKVVTSKHSPSMKTVIDQAISAPICYLKDIRFLLDPEVSLSDKAWIIFDLMLILGPATVSPIMGTIMFYLLANGHRQYLLDNSCEAAADKLGVTIRYDKPTPFTLFRFEWDRMLKGLKILASRLIKERPNGSA